MNWRLKRNTGTNVPPPTIIPHAPKRIRCPYCDAPLRPGQPQCEYCGMWVGTLSSIDCRTYTHGVATYGVRDAVNGRKEG